MNPSGNSTNPVNNNSTASQATSQTVADNDDLAQALASVQSPVQEEADNLDFETSGEPGMSGVPGMPAMQNTTMEPDPSRRQGLSVEAQARPAPVSQPVTQSPQAPSSLPVEPVVDPVASNPVPSVSDEEVDNSSIEQIKLMALRQLRPLMQHIELTPEERFEKYLMMLRASDDMSLIEPTYKAAEQISSEKLKAQALLDVINEINYLGSKDLVEAA